MRQARAMLTVHDHDRRRGGRQYVYPVVSRRSRGLSVGINLNPNAACNWRCLYCQVPGLVRGGGPAIDLPRLAYELGDLLDEVLAPGWMEQHVPAGARRLNDVAFSGDGEPTSSPQLVGAIDVAGEALSTRGLAEQVKLVLITNGSLVRQARVQEGLRHLARYRAEVWFKLDGASDTILRRLNGARTTMARQRANLLCAARLAPTWVQTLVMALDGEPSLDEAERKAYVEFLAGVLREGAPLRGVRLYGLARPSCQPEASRLRALPRAWLDAFAAEIHEGTGLVVSVDV